MHTKTYDTIIIGAGLAGLCCARTLTAAGQSCLVLEAKPEAGGRVKTDELDGFLLDRGFQVLITSYPESQQVLDYEALDLRAFTPGALVYRNDQLHKLIDPLRRPTALFSALRSPIGTFGDKRRLLALRSHARKGSLAESFARPEQKTLTRLQEMGFTQGMIEGFLRPWLGGIFLEGQLDTSTRMLDFVYRMFSQGDAVLPARGMGAIPQQIAAALPPKIIKLREGVKAVRQGVVTLLDDTELKTRSIVVATDGPAAAALVDDIPPVPGRGVTCVYYAAEKDPVDAPLLVLDGMGEGPVNNLCVPSRVAPSYAPAGAHLISATVLGIPDQAPSELETAIRWQLRKWFGPQVDGWRALRSYRIPHALPDQTPPALDPPERSVRVAPDIFVCGDHRDNASINGAMVSGRRAAEAVLADHQEASR
jgi:phytoene dehydrogenase-like protein